MLKRLAAGFFLLLFAALAATALWALWPVQVAFDAALVASMTMVSKASVTLPERERSAACAGQERQGRDPA